MPFVERRRFPRVSCPHPTRLAIAASVPVKILDISRCGALVATPHPVEPGERVWLHVSLKGKPVSAELEIRHSAPGSDKDGLFRLGAKLLALCETSQRTLEQFLERRLPAGCAVPPVRPPARATRRRRPDGPAALKEA
jgi:hypothetical protein